MVDLSPDLISRALGRKATRPYPAIFTDTRKPVPGGLFVALSGETFDGNQFVPQAIAKGAAGVVCSDPKAAPAGSAEIFIVPDTVTALRSLAREWRKQFTLPILSVVGNVGKTTTKELLAQILEADGQTVLKTEGSENGWVGIALTLLKLRTHHTVAVVEIGIDEPGSMEPHLELVDPTALVVSSLGPEHLEKLGRVEDAVEQELLAVDFMTARGRPVALPADNSFVRERSSRWPHARYFSARDVDPALRSALPHESPALLSNAQGALSIARDAGFNVSVRGPLVLPKGRAEIKAAGGIHWILDYYNSNPSSLEAGLALLEAESRRPGRNGVRVAFLGDMRELGEGSPALHAQFVQKIHEIGVDRLYLAGSEMRHLYDGLVESGFRGQLVHALQAQELIPMLASLHPRDTVLLKGSRGMRMEVLWHAFSSPDPSR